MKIKRRKRLKIKRRKTQKEIETFYDEMITPGRRRCSEPLCPQGVYSRETSLCYYHDKLKKGLLDAPTH